jgi:hypothetical protein
MVLCVWGWKKRKNRSRLDFLQTPTPYVFPFPLPLRFIRILASSFLPKQVNSIDSQSRNQKYGEVFCVFVRADTFLFFMRANLISQQTLVGGKMSRIVLQLWFELFYGDCRKNCI